MPLTPWSLDPSLIYVALAAGLYVLGSRGRDRPEPRHALAFFASLLVIVIALCSPIDYYADDLFWVHMVQHILLLTTAPSLLLLGRPWPRMWRAFPLDARTKAARTIARGRWVAPVRVLARPIPVWILFSVTIVAWHIPAAYDATLTSGAIHALEHAMFFFIGLLFWARVIDPGPLRPRLVWPVRCVYAASAMIVGWVLAIVLALEPHAIYGYYSSLPSRPGGITALTDQQIAAGIMWVPGSAAYAITFILGFYRWLEPDTSPARAPAAFTT
jgi:putative membrane protein